MKKFCALLLIVLMLAMAMPVTLAENTTTLTTTVPDATYTLNIPADQEIDFGATTTNIGAVTVTDASGFAEGKNLAVAVTYGDFTSTDAETVIPMKLYAVYKQIQGTALNSHEWKSGENVVFAGMSDGGVIKPYKRNEIDGNTYALNYIQVKIESADWGKALGGEYSSVLRFTAEVVKGE